MTNRTDGPHYTDDGITLYNTVREVWDAGYTHPAHRTERASFDDNYQVHIKLEGDLERDIRKALEFYPGATVTRALTLLIDNTLDKGLASQRPQFDVLKGFVVVREVSIPDRFNLSESKTILEEVGEWVTDSRSAARALPTNEYVTHLASHADLDRLGGYKYSAHIVVHRDGVSDYQYADQFLYRDMPMGEALLARFVEELDILVRESKDTWDLYTYEITHITHPKVVTATYVPSDSYHVPKLLDEMELTQAFVSLDVLARSLNKIGVKEDLNTLRSKLGKLMESLDKE